MELCNRFGKGREQELEDEMHAYAEVDYEVLEVKDARLARKANVLFLMFDSVLAFLGLFIFGF